MMNPAQAYAHYVGVVAARFTRANAVPLWAEQARMKTAPAHIRKMVNNLFEREIEKAIKLAQPYQNWQRERSLELQDEYGTGVAAAFLRAHGWDYQRARAWLFDEWNRM